MIYFSKNVVAEVLKTIKENRDCADVANDLIKISNMIHDVQTGFHLEEARQLNEVLRLKYPAIDQMLRVAQTLNPCVPSQHGIATSVEAECLQQDYYGILYDTAMKKSLIAGIQDYIESVR